MSIPLLPMRLSPFVAARTFEASLALLALGWVFRGAVEFALWTLEFVWR